MTNLKIYFNNIRNPFLKRKLSDLFFDALEDKLKNLKIKSDKCLFEVDIKYVSKDEIKKLNNEHRKVNKETDVLSFPLIDFRNENVDGKYNMLGDIVICKEIAKLQAKKFGHSFKREICFLALHGFLHLLGYDHIEEDDEKEMTEKAEKFLKEYGVNR